MIAPPPASAVSTVLERARGAADLRDLPGLLASPLVPAFDRGALWLLVCLARHEPRQKWVERVVRERLFGDPSRIGTFGYGGHPPGVPQRGIVPGLSEWEYFFHGIGCRLTRRTDETAIDVDFDPDGGCSRIHPFFYQEFLSSLQFPRFPERLLCHPEPLKDAWQADLSALAGAGCLDTARHVRLTDSGRALACAVAPAVERLAALEAGEEPGGPCEAALLAAALGDAVLVSQFLVGRPEASDAPGAAGTASSAVRAAAEAAGEAKSNRARRLRRRVVADAGKRPLNSSHALQALALLGRTEAEPMVRAILAAQPSTGLSPTAVAVVGFWDDPAWDGPLTGVAERFVAAESHIPVGCQYGGLMCCRILLRRLPTMDRQRRDRLARLLANDFRTGEGEAGLLLALLDREAGLRKLRRGLDSQVPMVRAEAAAALLLLGTPESEREPLSALIHESGAYDIREQWQEEYGALLSRAGAGASEGTP